jgi:hypothetical protein
MRARVQTSYSDNADILKRTDAIVTPIRSQGWDERNRQSVELASAILRVSIERMFAEFEQANGLRPGEACELMLNTGMNRLGCQR